MEVRDVSEVDKDGVAAEFPFELADGFEEGGRFDIAHGAADFCYDEIVVAGVAEELDVAFYFVGDVGDNLDCFAEIVAAAFLIDYALVDAAGSDVVGSGCLYVGETLVVAKVEVGLMAVGGDVAFAVFVWVECAGVNVDVRVEFWIVTL